MAATASAGWREDAFYQELNLFRKDPSSYQQSHSELNVRCSAPLEETYAPLNVSVFLEASSLFHASSISSYACPVVSHETCAPYCARFGGCGVEKRIGSFLTSVKYHNPFEILIVGPKDPIKCFHLFLESKNHCDHMLSCHANSVGASFIHTDRNALVADFAYIS